MSYRGITLGDMGPEVAPDAWVAPTAVLVGSVTLGARASVWYGTVVRADLAEIAVGEDSNLQDNCVVHADPGHPAAIGANVSVGHAAVIHGCTVEDDCLIGMSATIMNGAHIGRGSIVAAGAVVLPGTEVPPNSLVAGVPARVRRPTTEADKEDILRNAQRYVDLAARHARAGDWEAHR